MKKIKWRIIELSTNNAAMNMAIDEAISESVAAAKSPPTIRFYRWNPSAVSIGYFQSMEEEIDVKKCKALGVDHVRRRTGGGAVYHDFDGEITYSVIIPEEKFEKDITKSYHVICSWIVDSLKKLGIESEFKPINDIIVKNKKISGNAQTRRNKVVLQHGTILYDVDVEKMFSLLKVPDEKIRDKMISAVKERVTRVLDHADIDREELYHAMIAGFTKGKDFEFGLLTDEEEARAVQLAEERYSSEQWNLSR